MDNFYPIEVKLASKNGYFNPAESRGYYGRYDRSGYCVHWWGGGEGADRHDGIVNYMNSQAAQGNKSVNYVLSDDKVTLCVGPDNVAWCQESGNATEISVETQPTLGAEGYKKHGWLKAQLDERYGRNLVIHPHRYWFPTECPGTISLDRIAQEADKWHRGEHTNAPAPEPTPTPPAQADLEWALFSEGKRVFVCTKQPTNLWNFNSPTWSGIKSIKTFNKGDEIEIVGYCTNHSIKATYLVTQYSFDKRVTNGINVVDLTLKEQPAPPPTQTDPQPSPPPAAKEWVTNLRDIDDTEYWLKEDTALIDITTGKPMEKNVILFKDASFMASALTKANGVEYRITDYSFKKGIYNGVPIDKLTLTPPGVPDIPPVNDHPIDKNWLIAALQALLVAIQEIINKIKN